MDMVYTDKDVIWSIVIILALHKEYFVIVLGIRFVLHCRS